MDRIVIPGAVEGEVDPPSSKSYAQRAIAAALLADGRKDNRTSAIRGVELCDDTEAALRVAESLGAAVERTEPGTYTVRGGLSAPSKGLDIGESGLSTRLFTPIASLCDVPVTITGRDTILTRPMTMMLSPLRDLGVEVSSKDGYLPLVVRGPIRGGEVNLDGSVSSQFLTGLLMALPLAAEDTTVRVSNLKSIPYIDMTLDVMERFGIEVDHRNYEEFYIPGSQSYTPADLHIEGDWSAASCLLVAGAVGGSVTVRNLNPVSLQADVAIIEALSRAGARIEQSGHNVTVSRRELNPFEFDATNCPDLFPALAALAASCGGTSTIVGTSRLTHKECNRAEAIRTEYGKLGIEVDISKPNVMRITGRAADMAAGETGRVADSAIGVTADRASGGDPGSGGDPTVAVDSFRDHRMAMSLAVAGLNHACPVAISDPWCVSKSYGNFWNDFNRLRGE